jgi:hypothetical protein
LIIISILNILFVAILKIFEQNSLENIHENHLSNYNQGKEVNDGNCPKVLDKDKHGLVPVFPSKHSKY